MAPLGKTIASRITLGVLAVQLLVLPTLYFSMVYLLKQSNEELFLNNTRGHARFVADGLERIGDSAAESEIVEVLDSVVLSGSGIFSELVGPDKPIRSSLVDAIDAAEYQEDFKIGEHNDEVYYISVPVQMGNETLSLRVGFDERPYFEQNARAYKNGLIIILAYLVVLILLLPLVGRRVVRPVKELQQASRQIASGVLSQQLTVDSGLVEIVDLSNDLEHMKSRLIGINKQLEMEIQDHEHAETQRRSLEQQLRHSQRLETVGTMAGGIAHELNNILVPIILYTDTAMDDLADDSPIRDDLDRVMRAANRAKAIVSQILTFSHKLAAGDHVAINMADVVRESVDLLEASLPSSVELDVAIDPDCLPVLGDAALMSQLVLNLSTNALQSLRDTKGSVSVSLDVVDVDDELAAKYPSLGRDKCVRLMVRDTGHGMDKRTLERIFEPFYTTRAVGEGTGLGMSVVHGIVTDLNGAIEIESELGSGSTFYVYLPVLQDLRTS